MQTYLPILPEWPVRISISSCIAGLRKAGLRHSHREMDKQKLTRFIGPCFFVAGIFARRDLREKKEEP
jgi:hypothetical protein